MVLPLALAGCFAPAPADHLYICLTGSDCPGGYDCAADGYCYRFGHLPTMSDPCANGMQDEDETGVDCGGPTCPDCCPLDAGCGGPTDCDSGICNAISATCVADDCHDGMRDDAETDVDCGGGTCPACGAGKACHSPGDCTNFLCNQTTETCVADPCLDGVKDQSETDTDCGGLCVQKCKNGGGCNTPNDCVSGATCSAGKCQVAHCVDGVADNGETDIDCGGADCSPCPVGKTCAAGSDCASSFCNATSLKCVANGCQDGVKDGSESDVDCGGPSGACPRCSDGKACSGGTDCNSGGGSICTSGNLCCHPSGTACNGVACGTATDNCGQTLACGNNGACADSTRPYCKSGCCTSYNDATQACAGKACGTIDDGCGATYACADTCTAQGKSCSNAPSYVCCDGAAAACAGHDCQTVQTPCGPVSCGCSVAGQSCYQGACCAPQACITSCAGGYDDGCGHACPIKKCASGQVCCDPGCSTAKFGCP